MTDQVDGTAGHPDGTPDHLDGALTLEQAAAYFRVSERTLRRRIKSGTVTAYKVPTAQGYEWRVVAGQPDGTPVQVDTPSIRQDVRVDSTPASPELLKALDLVDRLQQDNQQLAGQVGFLQAKLQSAEEQIRLLSAPQDEPEPAAEPGPVQRAPWWKRLLG